VEWFSYGGKTFWKVMKTGRRRKEDYGLTIKINQQLINTKWKSIILAITTLYIIWKNNDKNIIFTSHNVVFYSDYNHKKWSKF